MKLDQNAVIFALSANKDLAAKVCEKLGTKLSDVHLAKFPSKEVLACPIDTVRGKKVFIIQSTCPPVNDTLMEVLIFIDSLRRASAGEINVIMPYFGYARQDRKSKPREPISSRLVADLLVTAGAHRVITFDLHAAQIQGFFSCLEDDISAIPLLGHTILKDKDIDKKNLVTVSPDHGGVNRARKIAEKLNTPIAIIDKRRNSKYQPEVMNIIGDVRDKRVVLVDDMIDTAGTLCNAAKAIIEIGGAKEVYACASHGVLSGPAIERIENSCIKELTFLNTIPPLEGACSKIKYLDVSPIFADAIQRIYEENSMSVLF